MNKKLLKSLLLGSAALAVVVTSGAFFTSTIRMGGELEAGYLLLAIDGGSRSGTISTDYATHTIVEPESYADYGAYLVSAEMEDGTIVNPNVIGNYVAVAPGESLGDVYFTVRNRGTIPMDYRISEPVADWIDAPRAGQTLQTPHGELECGPLEEYDETMIIVTDLEAVDVASGDPIVENIQAALNDQGYTVVEGGNVVWEDGYYVSQVELQPGQYVVYRSGLALDENANNCYQGAEADYDLTIDAKQPNSDSWEPTGTWTVP